MIRNTIVLIWVALGAALCPIAPAFAGTYDVYSVSGSGAVTITGPNGIPQVTTLNSGGYFSQPLQGHLAYTFTEQWHYSWEPDDQVPDDEPVDQQTELDGNVTFNMWGTSSSEDYAGCGSASANIGGVSASGWIDVQQGGAQTNDAYNGLSQPIAVVKSLSGWDGEFTLTYTAEMDTGTNGAVMGTLNLTTPTGSRAVNHYIYVTTPRVGAQIQGTPLPNFFTKAVASVTVNGVWKLPPVYTATAWRIEIDGLDDSYNDWQTGAPQRMGVAYTGNAAAPWCTWSWSNSFQSDTLGPMSYSPTASLQYQDTDGFWYGSPWYEPPMWHSSTTFTVLY